jgi:hypothetical protein
LLLLRRLLLLLLRLLRWLLLLHLLPICHCSSEYNFHHIHHLLVNRAATQRVVQHPTSCTRPCSLLLPPPRQARLIL